MPAVYVDLRTCRTLNDIHEIVSRISFNKAISQKHHSNLYSPSLNSILELSAMSEPIFVIDHGELLLDETSNWNEMLSFLRALEGAKFLLTCRQFPSTGIPMEQFRLEMPKTHEVVAMLSHWIDGKPKWIKDILPLVGNHPFVIRMIGTSCAGSYTTSAALKKRVGAEVKHSKEVHDYFRNLVSKFEPPIKSWLALSSLLEGSIRSDLIPRDELLDMNNQGLILLQGGDEVSGRIAFHPILVEATCENLSKTDAASLALERLERLPRHASTTFYEFLCKIYLDRGEEAARVLRECWQDWAEVIGSTRTRSIIESGGIWYEYFSHYHISLFSGIVRIFQGSARDLSEAQNIFEEIYNEPSIDNYIRVLAFSEYIECLRKRHGSRAAIEKFLARTEFVNECLEESQKKFSKTQLIRSS